jgi:AcrR family transcriptional regulator
MVKNTKKPQSTRVAHKRQQARREILESAQAILVESGPEAVTLASVAGRLGMTKQSIYHYFASKEALTRGLVTTLLDDEIGALIKAVRRSKSKDMVLGALIKAFYLHYVEQLAAFRIIYCQSQLYSSSGTTLDDVTLRDEIHPRTRHLFDVLEEKIAGETASKTEQRRARQLAFTAWTSVLGLMTMLSVADATNDPIAHSEKALIRTMADVFNAAAG